MFKPVILFVLLSSVISWAHENHNDVSKATYLGVGKAVHEGDFANFSLLFEAKCFDDQPSPRAKVIENVAMLTQWLLRADAGAVSYTVNLINTWRNEDNAFSDNNCVHKYNAKQNVTVTLKKIDGEASLDSQVLQQFFNDLQTLIAPGNYAAGSESLAEVTARITAIEKGVYEETADLLEIEARAKAQEKATRSFKAFLGSSYQGWWHLDSTDFSARDYSRLISVGNQTAGNTGDSFVYSDIKLEPITFTAEGTFLFHYKTQINYLAHE